MVCHPSWPPGSLEDGDVGSSDFDVGSGFSLDVAGGFAVLPPLFRLTSTIATTAPTMITIASTPRIIGSFERCGGSGVKPGSPPYGLYWPSCSCEDHGSVPYGFCAGKPPVW